MPSNQNLLCEVLFRDYRTGKKITIAGKINLDKLVSSKEKSITVENHVFENQRWKKSESRIPKVDVIKITAYKAQIFLNYKKGKLLLDSEASDFQKKIDNLPMILE
jgi:predicted metallo-beta-lactamase superfamily hydrolase